LTPGARNYWKSHDLADLPDAAIKAILGAVRTLPSPECEVFIAHVGGAMARVPANATAWPNRNAHFIMNAHTRWRDKAQDAACIAWARQLSDATAPYASGSVYINFMPDDENDRVERAYGANYRSGGGNDAPNCQPEFAERGIPVAKGSQSKAQDLRALSAQAPLQSLRR
jgi:hypothetical protein